MSIYAIIPAGGKGTRSGFSAPKQYLKFNNKELIVYTLQIFQKNKNVDEIALTVHPDYFGLINNLKKKYKISKLKTITSSGRERQDSVYNALQKIEAEKNDLVIVHDAARPLLSQEILNDSIDTAKKKGNALVCIKARDTLVKGKKTVYSYIDRKEVYYVQTPQIFKFSDLKTAMDKAKKDNFYGTDESMLIKRLGKKINIVEGSSINFKVTNKSDIELLKKILTK